MPPPAVVGSWRERQRQPTGLPPVQFNSVVVLLVVAPRVPVHGGRDAHESHDGELQCKLRLVPSETNSSDISRLRIQQLEELIDWVSS